MNKLKLLSSFKKNLFDPKNVNPIKKRNEPFIFNQDSQRSFAQLSVMLSAIAHCDDPQFYINNRLPGWKIVWDGTPTREGNYAFIVMDPTEKYYLLAIKGPSIPSEIFMGWEPFVNWILGDFNVLTQEKWPYTASSDILVSSGAFLGFHDLLKMRDSDSGQFIFDYLKEHVVIPGKKIVVTGHGLGGTIATAFASYLSTALTGKKYAEDNIYLFTFGAPAAGNSHFVKDLDYKALNAWYYENNKDIMPRFPSFLSMLVVTFLFFPAPDASKIPVNYMGSTTNLREAFLMITGMFYKLGYQQPGSRYEVFSNKLYKKYKKNTLEHWLHQAARQHDIVNYANYLKIELDDEIIEQNSILPDSHGKKSILQKLTK